MSAPARTVNDGDWDGGCEAAVVNAAQLAAYSSAMLAGDASGPLDSNPSTARGSEFSFWGGVYSAALKQYLGHVAWHDPIDPAYVFMASATAANNGQQLGHNLARIKIDTYQRITHLPYRGHSFRHGTQAIARTIPAGGDVTPLVDMEDEDMARIYVVTDGPEKNVTYLVAGGRMSLIQPLDTLALSAAQQLSKDSPEADPAKVEYYPVSSQQITYMKTLLGFGTTTAATPTLSNADRLAIIQGVISALPTTDAIVQAARQGSAEAVTSLAFVTTAKPAG
jgi:hypothetical protein